MGCPLLPRCRLHTGHAGRCDPGPLPEAWVAVGDCGACGSNLDAAGRAATLYRGPPAPGSAACAATGTVHRLRRWD